MAQITAALVKQLREMTDSPMMECKKALVEADGDIEKAVDVLRKMGMAKAVKKAGRETNEGTVAAYVSECGKVAALVEVTCETDFVVVQRVWDAADAKRLENDGVVVAAKQLKDGGVHLGRELEHEHALVQVVVDARLQVLACAVGHRARARRRRANDAIVADERQLRVVHARERVEAHRALLAGACARHDLTAKHHGNVVRRRVCRIQHALVQVDARVRERAAHGLL